MDWLRQEDIQLPIIELLLGVFVLAAFWIFVTFMWQVVSHIRGQSRTFAYSPQFIRIAAVAFAGFFVSSQSVGAMAVSQVATEKIDSNNSNKDSEKLLLGSGAINIATLSYIVAKRRATMRSIKFVSKAEIQEEEKERQEG